MRGAVDGLPAAHSIVEGLPPVLREGFVARFVGAFDDALAPVHAVLDNVEGYFDPDLAPPDFLPWLAGWVGVSLNERWSEDRRRELVSDAIELYQWRGTARGLRAAVRTYTGVEPELLENGSVAWSPRPGQDHPGGSRPELVVRVRVGDLDFDEGMIDRIVADAKPAHVPHRLEIVPGDLDDPSGDDPTRADPATGTTEP